MLIDRTLFKVFVYIYRTAFLNIIVFVPASERYLFPVSAVSCRFTIHESLLTSTESLALYSTAKSHHEAYVPLYLAVNCCYCCHCITGL